MYILEVSYGCPSKKYPLNGIFQMDQAKALFDSGNKVVFSAIDVRSFRKWRRWGITEHTEKDIPVVEFNFPVGPFFPNLQNKICKIGFASILYKVIQKYGKPDIVHVHFGGTAMCVVEACKQEGIPYVLTEHSSSINRDDLTEAEIATMRYVYKNAAGVIAVSNTLAQRIKHYSGVTAEVIPNIIDFSIFSCSRKKHRQFRFISAANLNRCKGFDVLLKAFQKCHNNGIDATLTIMGDGPEKESLLKFADKLCLNDKVKFYGKYERSQFAEELATADAFVLASRGETFGVVYAEAMACGVPVIATHCGGPEDFVNDSNGLLVDVNDVDGLADAMMWMYYHSKEYDNKKIVKTIRETLSARAVAKKIENVLEIRRNEENDYGRSAK